MGARECTRTPRLSTQFSVAMFESKHGPPSLKDGGKMTQAPETGDGAQTGKGDPTHCLILMSQFARLELTSTSCRAQRRRG